MLTDQDLLGPRSRQALAIIRANLDFLETVESLEQLQLDGNATEIEEIGMLLEGYMLDNAPDPDQVEAEMRAELDAIARGG